MLFGSRRVLDLTLHTNSAAVMVQREMDKTASRVKVDLL
jgi:hypothetical protein